MYIAHLINLSHPMGEGNVYAIKLSNFLRKFGHDVTIYSLCNHGDSKRIRNLLNEKIPIRELKCNDVPGIIFRKNEVPSDLKYIPISYLFRELDSYDLINVHSYKNPNFLFTCLFNYIKKRKIILTHSQLNPQEWFNPESPSNKRKYIHALRRHALRQVRSVVLYNSVYKKHYIDLGIKKEDIKIIPPGVDVNFINQKNNQDKDPIRDKYGLKDHFVITFVGRFKPRRGIETLFNAIPLIKSEFPRIKTLMVGGPVDYYQSLCLKFGLSEDVIFAGYQSNNDLPAYYSASDICVWLPNPPGTFGMVLLEAMACGKPVIGSYTDSIRYLIEDGKNGFIINHDDHIRLAQLIIKCARDKEMGNQLGLNGKYLVKKKYMWEFTAKKHIELYRSVIQREKSDSKCI